GLGERSRGRRCRRRDRHPIVRGLVGGITREYREGSLDGAFSIRKRLGIFFYADQQTLRDARGINVLVARAGLAVSLSRGAGGLGLGNIVLAGATVRSDRCVQRPILHAIDYRRWANIAIISP